MAKRMKQMYNIIAIILDAETRYRGFGMEQK